MAVTEETRHRMHMAFEEVVGADVAVTLMEHLPPVGWADVATHRDLDQQTLVLQHELGQVEMELRTEMREGFAAIDARFAGVDARFAAIDARFEATDARFEAIDARFGELRAELVAELERRNSQLLLQLMGAMAALLTIFTVVGRLIA